MTSVFTLLVSKDSDFSQTGCSEDLRRHGTFNHMARVAQGGERPALCFLLGTLSDQVQEGDFALISVARLGESGWRYTVALGTWVTY